MHFLGCSGKLLGCCYAVARVFWGSCKGNAVARVF